MPDTPHPVEITLHRTARTLEIAFDDGARFTLPCEYLRVYSPSAEVQGHHGVGAVLQVGKAEVNIDELRPIGHYALKSPSTMATAAACSPGAICTNWAVSRHPVGKTTWTGLPPRISRAIPFDATGAARMEQALGARGYNAVAGHGGNMAMPTAVPCA